MPWRLSWVRNIASSISPSSRKAISKVLLLPVWMATSSSRAAAASQTIPKRLGMM